MSTTKVTISSVKGTSTLVRARFGPGMLLQHEDLEQLNTYTRELSRLLFRSFFGCGVVCGLVVDARTKYDKVIVTVTSGLALDCTGDPVYVPKDQSLTLADDYDSWLPRWLWVILCGNTKCCAPRTPVCASDDDESPSVCTRERDGFEIRIVSELPKCICGCKQAYEEKRECYADHYAGKCGCDAGEGCDCSCNCVLLAQLAKPDREGEPWRVDHAVRRFVRPVLMHDPKVKKWKKPPEPPARRAVQPGTQRPAEPSPPPGAATAPEAVAAPEVLAAPETASTPESGAAAPETKKSSTKASKAKTEPQA